ncbi:hypothetical protein C8R44DRAFT_166 [Mycena epipterygia]|nr:hypothetical protein C8R44DRAFT_166 [Mycena epipterygia]
MSFPDLPEDVVCYALSACEISSVVSISQTSKHLHLLAFTPTVWMSLVEDLRNRGFVDRLSAADIRKMSTQSLVAAVKRLVLGPEAWSPPRIQSPQPKSLPRILHKLTRHRGRPIPDPPRPQPRARIVLHPSMPPAIISSRPAMSVPYGPNFHVIPGGKYALFIDQNNTQVLGCWRVSDDSLLGTYHSVLPLASTYIRDFAEDPLYGGERANIVIRIGSSLRENVCFVEVISWDFATGITELLSLVELQDVKFNTQSPPTICGGLSVVRTYRQSPWEEIYVIVDWNAQQCCKILCTGDETGFNSMKLISNYFILITTSPSGVEQEIRICAITSLSAWAPVGQHNTANAVRLSNIPHVALSTTKFKGAVISPAVMAVHESPLERGTYRVWLFNQYSVDRLLSGPTYHALLSRFRLSLPGTGGRQLTWRQQSRTSTEVDRRRRGISYSGHTSAVFWTPAASQRIFPPEVPPTPIVVGIPEGMERAWTKVAPYSGALTYFTQNAVVLCYFE